MKKENKIQAIIDEDFDSRMVNFLVSYIIDKGWDRISKITDEQINELEGESIFSEEFMKALVTSARRITRECSLVNDFIPFIKKM